MWEKDKGDKPYGRRIFKNIRQMSTWYNIYDEDDVEYNISDDTVEVYIGDDYGGAIYVSIPLSSILKVIPPNCQ